MKNTNKKVAKGYRLKPETHQLIMELQKKIKGTKDDAINRACSVLYSIITDSKTTAKTNKMLINKKEKEKE